MTRPAAPASRRPLEFAALVVLVAAVVAVARLGGALGAGDGGGARTAAAPPGDPSADDDDAPPPADVRGVDREILRLPDARDERDAVSGVLQRPDWRAPLFVDGEPTVVGESLVTRDGLLTLVRWERLGRRLRYAVALPFRGGRGMRVLVLRSNRDWEPPGDDAAAPQDPVARAAFPAASLPDADRAWAERVAAYVRRGREP